MNRILVGVPVDTHVEPAFLESFQKAISITQSEGWVNPQPMIVAYRVTNHARNLIVKRALDEEYTHILFMDADMKFPVGLLGKLLQQDKDIIGAFYVRKVSGFLPCVFQSDDDGHYTYWTDIVEKVDALGTGALLVRTEIFKTIEFPWFEYEPYINDDGDVKQVSEDVVFCRKAKEAGFDIWIDGHLTCGHVGPFIVTTHSHNREKNCGTVRPMPYAPEVA